MYTHLSIGTWFFLFAFRRRLAAANWDTMAAMIDYHDEMILLPPKLIVDPRCYQKRPSFWLRLECRQESFFLVLLLWFPTIEDCWWRHWREKAAVIIVRNWKTFPGKIANWRTYFLRYYYQCWLPLQLSNKKRRFFGNVIKEIMSLMLPFVTTMALRSYTSTCQFAKMFNEQKKYSAEKMHFVGYWNWLLTTFVSYRCPQMDKKSEFLTEIFWCRTSFQNHQFYFNL